MGRPAGSTRHSARGDQSRHQRRPRGSRLCRRSLTQSPYGTRVPYREFIKIGKLPLRNKETGTSPILLAIGCQIPGIHNQAVCTCHIDHMKRLIALAVLALASQAVVTFAGEPAVSSKEVVAPPPPPPPVSFFRGNEFDIGAFGTYVTGTNGGGTRTRQTVFDDDTSFTLSSSGSPHGWVEAWILLITYLGNMSVSGSRVRV
jgi:hypothetical protein